MGTGGRGRLDRFRSVDDKIKIDSSFEPVTPEERELRVQEATGEAAKPDLPIFSILNSIVFSEHFVVIGDVGTGKSTATPVYEFEKQNRRRRVSS